MRNALRLAAALALPAALSLAGGAFADPMAVDHPMSASPMSASPMAATPMATDSMAADAKAKPKMKPHAKKKPAPGAMGTDAMAPAPASTGAMGH